MIALANPMRERFAQPILPDGAIEEIRQRCYPLGQQQCEGFCIQWIFH